MCADTTWVGCMLYFFINEKHWCVDSIWMQFYLTMKTMKRWSVPAVWRNLTSCRPIRSPVKVIIHLCATVRSAVKVTDSLAMLSSHQSISLVMCALGLQPDQQSLSQAHLPHWRIWSPSHHGLVCHTISITSIRSPVCVISFYLACYHYIRCWMISPGL